MQTRVAFHALYFAKFLIAFILFWKLIVFVFLIFLCIRYWNINIKSRTIRRPRAQGIDIF